MESAPVVYGKYQLIELLARGGMAEVFKAKAHGVEGFEKILVIKRILSELGENPEFVEMFVNEAKIAVTLSHANIVQVFDLGRADENYFIAMEYVAGADLATVLRRARKYDKPLPVELAVYLVSELAKGLDYAHRRRDADLQPMNIVHRDVSPQNVLVSWEGEVKLTDFGIAKARTTVPEGTENGVIKGKYAYRAPEQARGESCDARTDLFALGVVLYEALAGTHPFLQPSTYETLQRARRGESTPLREAAPHVPDELVAIVEKAMSPRAEDRHANAGLLYEDLIQFLYATGRRVGAHDLAGYLVQLRAAAEGRRSQPEESDVGLKAAFEIETAGRVMESSELTPVEVPSARTSGTGRVSTGASRRTNSRAVSSSAPQGHDITLLMARNVGAQAAEHVRRNGGEILPEVDGCFRAVFGLRTHDGRDTEAAARAALALAHASPGSFVAVEAGRVEVSVKGDLGRELEPNLGELVSVTLPVLDVSSPGRPALGSSAARAARRYFDLRTRGLVANGNPVEELIGERNLTEALGQFVGRRDVLRRIGEVLAVAAKGRQCLLSLVGEAGTGKTRLLIETLRRLRRGGHDVAMHVCRVPAGSSDIPLATAQEMLRVLLGIEELEGESETAEKVARLRELGLQKPELDAVSRTLGLATDQGVTSTRPLLAAIARIATKLAEDRPTIFAFDDFEGVDAESLALLRALVERPSHSRIVVAVAHRPDFRVDWGEGPSLYEVRVGPLDDEDVARLVAARLGTGEVPAELLRDVKLKSAGNPLYVEEYLLALRDANVVRIEREGAELRAVFRPETQKVALPRSLRGIVASRLRRVPTTAKEALHVASVIGGRFHDAMIAHITGWPLEETTETLEDLVARGLLVRAGAREYGFSHGLLAEVLRDELPLEGLKELHGAVGRAFEEVYPDHLDDLAERLAFHHREAGNRTRAIDFLVRAADRLETEQALRGAIAFLRRSLDMLAQDTVARAQADRDRTLELYRRLGDLCVRARELQQGVELMEAALDVAEGLGRDELVARFSLLRGQCLAFLNRFAEAQRWLDRARDVARGVGNRDLLRDVTTATADLHARNGEYGRAIGLLREALELAREASDSRAQIRCLLPLALAHAGRADREEAEASLAEAQRLAGPRPERIVECEVLKATCLVAFYIGDPQRALDAGHRALELGKEYGFAYEAAVNAHNLGETYLRLGDFKRAFAMLRYSYDVARDHGFQKLQFTNLRVLGFIDATKLGSEEGRQRIVEAATFAEENGYLWDVVQARYMLGVVEHQRGAIEESERMFREVLHLASETGMQHYARAAEEALAALEAGQPIPMPV